MEKIPGPKSKESLEIKSLIKTLANKAPQEGAMNRLVNVLGGALKEAEKPRVNSTYVHLILQSVYEIHSALAARGVDVLVEMEEITEKIKALAAPQEV